MNKLTSSELQTILVLYQTKSFALASKSLHKVPTAISYTLNNLEKKIQVKLFTKSNKKLVPTKACKYLVSKAEAILEEIDTALINTRHLAEDFEPYLNIAVNNIICLDPLYELCKQSDSLFPNTQINISIEVYNGVWEALLNDKVDIAIGAPHDIDLSPDLNAFFLGICHWIFCIRPDHRLIKQKLPLSNEILRQYPAICVKDTSSLFPPKNAWLLKGQRAIYVPDYASKIKLHENGVGIGFLPEYFAKPYLEKGALIDIDVKNPKNPTNLWLVVKEKKNRGPAFSWWFENLKDPIVYKEFFRAL